jgi:hypothetical protein
VEGGHDVPVDDTTVEVADQGVGQLGRGEHDIGLGAVVGQPVGGGRLGPTPLVDLGRGVAGGRGDQRDVHQDGCGQGGDQEAVVQEPAAQPADTTRAQPGVQLHQTDGRQGGQARLDAEGEAPLVRDRRVHPGQAQADPQQDEAPPFGRPRRHHAKRQWRGQQHQAEVDRQRPRQRRRHAVLSAVGARPEGVGLEEQQVVQRQGRRRDRGQAGGEPRPPGPGQRRVEQQDADQDRQVERMNQR